MEQDSFLSIVPTIVKTYKRVIQIVWNLQPADHN